MRCDAVTAMGLTRPRYRLACRRAPYLAGQDGSEGVLLPGAPKKRQRSTAPSAG